MNIIEAIDDPNIFAPNLKDPKTWRAWRAFLKALFALPLSKSELKLYRECTERKRAPKTSAKEGWLIVGRKGGKSKVLSIIATFLAAFFDWSPYLSIGERGVIFVLAKDREQAGVIMGFVKGLFHAVPMIERLIVSETTESLTLSNRITIKVGAANFGSVRGPTVVAALCDEVAFWPTDENGANCDAEVIAALKPAMATVGGGLLLVASSPYAKKGVLFEAHQKYFGQDDDEVLVWKAPTRRMNPNVRQRLIDDALEKDPARYMAEYMVQFRDDIEGFVGLDVLQAAIDRDVHERERYPGVKYVGFVDLSGGGSDACALAIAHKEADIGVLDCLRHQRPPFSTDYVVEEFAKLLKSYGITSVVGDKYAREWPVQAFKRFGINYEQRAKPKSEIYLDALPLLNSGKIRLLDNRQMRSEILSLERQVSKGGRDSVDHPRGQHDDLANAALGALVLCTGKGTFDICKLSDGLRCFMGYDDYFQGQLPMPIGRVI